MATEMKIPTKIIKSIDDKNVLGMIPTDVLAMLGESDGSGYDLRTDQRHLFFTRGVVKYTINKADLEVEIDD